MLSNVFSIYFIKNTSTISYKISGIILWFPLGVHYYIFAYTMQLLLPTKSKATLKDIS